MDIISGCDYIYEYVKQLLEKHGEVDKSSYTKDRKVIWIGKQPLLTKPQEIDGVKDEFITRVAKVIYPDCDYILIAGGNTHIKLHRDSGAMDRTAITLNLGGKAKFEYDGKERILEHGSLTKFNCKKLHGVTIAQGNRIMIGMWKRSEIYAKAVNNNQLSLF